MRRGKRGSGRRRLRELTRSVVETMEILEEVREKHSGVGGMSRALTKVIKLGLQTCMLEPEDRGHSTVTSSGRHVVGNTAAPTGKGSWSTCSPTQSLPSSSSAAAEGGAVAAEVGKVIGSGGTAGSATDTNMTGKQRGGAGAGAGAGAGSSTVFLESGAGVCCEGAGGWSGGGEDALPLGVATVLWELECCAAQALITLMNLNEARPNHFGVFRPCVYVEEMRMLEAKVLELVQEAANPREEKNARLETTVAAGIRNCVARLWWSRRAGENAESMSWDDFEQAFQTDFGTQLPKTMEVLRSHIAVRYDDYRPVLPHSSLPLPPSSDHPDTTTVSSRTFTNLPEARKARESTPTPTPAPLSNVATGVSTTVSAQNSGISAAGADGSSGGGGGGGGTASADSTGAAAGGAGSAVPSFNPGTFAAVAAAIEATTAASVARLTAAAAGGSGTAVSTTNNTNDAGNGAMRGLDHSPPVLAGADQPAAAAAAARAAGTGDGEHVVVVNVETGEEEEHQRQDQQQQGETVGPAAAAASTARVGSGRRVLERGFSRLLSSVRREREGARIARGAAEGDAGNGSGDGGSGSASSGGGFGSGGGASSSSTSASSMWRVTAGLYEEVTWTHGGLYEAFQALADPRRVVFAMGVVDDGPVHEGGDGEEGWANLSPVVVQGLLGLSVQQVCCGGQHAAILTDCGEIFTWGRGGFGRLGHGNREMAESPKRIEALEGIPCVQVACGFAYTAAVTASGELYTWGAGENGRLGLGDVEDRHTPSRVEGLHSKVKEVYAGSVHSCVLTREGTVYAFGKHEYTGHGDKEDVLEPRLIPTFSGRSEALVRQISVGPGGYHTMALTCQGQVYAWGHNRVAQLGIGNSFTVPRNMEGAYFLPSPQLVESLVGMNIVKVVAGWGHSAALTVNGQLYVCGRNYQGQLGLGSPQAFPRNERGHPFQAEFCLIDRLQHLKIRQIACGGEHSVAVAENGEVWSFGAGQKGQLGHESTTREDFPRLVQALKRSRREILHVACGNNCTLVLAGGVAFPTLFELTAAAIRGNPKLWADVESLGLLPPSLVDSLNRTVSD